MDGPDLIARTLSWPAVDDKFGNRWQYHPRSDRHSKVACWAVLFDTLQRSALLRRHVTEGTVVFGINQTMRDYRTNRTKDLDLVLARPAGAVRPTATTLTDLAIRYSVRLTDTQQDTLRQLPVVRLAPAGSVLVALEAKACMTAHIKALPRLFDELTSSYSTVHGESNQALAVGFVMINAGEWFLSPDLNRRNLTTEPPVVSVHVQPTWARRALEKVTELRRRPNPNEEGFDALGVVMVDMRNDGTPVSIVAGSPAPADDDVYSYNRMIGRLVQSYDVTFAQL